MTLSANVTITAPELLTKVSQEFQALAEQVEQLQDTISGLLTKVSPDSHLVVQAQALDYVFQHMTQLGAIISAAADQSSPQWRLSTGPLLDNISLSGLASRLSGTVFEPPVTGELEMY